MLVGTLEEAAYNRVVGPVQSPVADIKFAGRNWNYGQVR